MFWNSQTVSNIGPPKAIIYENGQYILIPESGSNIYTSINGLTHNSISVGSSGNFVSMAFGKGIYVLIGTSNSIWYSSNISSSFTQVSDATSFSNCRKMIYRNNIFIAVGSDTVTENMSSNTVGSIYTSPDGINWTRKFRTSNSSDFNDIY